MSVEVTVRVSGQLEQPDLEALREWLERNYPGGWELSSGPGVDGTLGSTTDVLQGVLDNYVQGLGIATGEVLATVLREKIREWFERIRGQYPGDDEWDFDVETEQRDAESRTGGEGLDRGDAEPAT